MHTSTSCSARWRAGPPRDLGRHRHRAGALAGWPAGGMGTSRQPPAGGCRNPLGRTGHQRARPAFLSRHPASGLALARVVHLLAHDGTRGVPMERRNPMLWTIIVVLLVLWLLGLIGGIGAGFIHLLLVLALIVLVFQLLSGRSVA